MKERIVKIMLVAGARPNFMKIGPLYKALKKYKNSKLFFVHTGQHYDANMSHSFLRDLGLPRPAVFLGVGSGTHAEQTAKTMVAFETACLKIRPDCVVVVGDVNPTMACAITAKKLQIPVAHVEAGLRSGDMTMPEEVNRRITDSISDYLFTPSSDADENLLNEGVPKSKIYFTGNIMIDSLVATIGESKKTRAFEKLNLKVGSYGLVTLHRPSNVDESDKLHEICEELLKISKKIPIVFPVHPRTKKNLESSNNLKRLESSGTLKLISPLPYLEFMNLLANAKFVATDSGGIQEETTFLGIPCLTLRENTERPVTITQGTNELVKLPQLSHKIDLVLRGKWKKGKRPRYWDGNTAKRIASILSSLM